MRKLLGALLVLFSAAPTTSGAEKDIVDTAVAGQFKTLVAAVKAAGLVDTLKGDGPFTVFAPTDEAFAKLPPGTVEELLKPQNKDKLRSILTYHVVSGRLTAADVAKLDGKSVKTLQASPVAIRVDSGTVLVGMAAVSKADVPARNGVIHVIDTVLLPPAGTRADHSNPAASKAPPKPADGDAPLAEGFPDATRAGAIEVKKYPAYRSAVARSNKAGVASGDLLFFSLFNHIQRNRIAMTAPVINTYRTPRMIETPGAAGDVTMEFVYRTPEAGKAGPDGPSVEVVDHPARTFVCLGFQGGDLSADQMRDALATLRTWLGAHRHEWVEDGPPRRIGYHGPMTPPDQRLWEVQIPVKAAR
jgi:uncharacterized surface protein with fasciclin (FAS1) repeats